MFRPPVAILPPLLALVLSACPDNTATQDDAGTAASGGSGGDGSNVGSGAPFSLGMTAPSDDAAFQVKLLSATPAPPQKYENDWVVEVLDMDGAPLVDADLYFVQPYMPIHGHDGSFEPDITAGDAPGTFVVKRINLWMGGPWEVRFFVKSGDIDDRAVIDVFIED